MRVLFLLAVSILGEGLLLSTEAFGAKKDFRGLFGSYRRERFIENEARSSDFGIDLMLSTLIPLTPIVKSSEDGTSFSAMHYATFFNFETTFFLTLNYHFETFANIGYYTYETRKENTKFQNPQLPLFQQFEMEVVPGTLGIKYRLSTDDIVPYFGVGAGVAYVRRKGFYDYNNNFLLTHSTVFTAQAIVGLEFFFAARTGIRLEASAHYLKLPIEQFTTGGSPATFPIIEFQGNPWSVRYASGLFFLF